LPRTNKADPQAEVKEISLEGRSPLEVNKAQEESPKIKAKVIYHHHFLTGSLSSSRIISLILVF
jgi:hypothetical protein